MKRKIQKAFIMIAAMLIGGAAHADTLTFDTPVVTSPTQAPGVWYTDRYAPAGFTSPVSFDGGNRLRQTIAVADGASNRPGAYSDAFYNTQGRKLDLAAGTSKMSIDLYVPADWGTTGRRMAGFWGTGFDNANTVTAYPIIEFTSNSEGTGLPRFRGFNTDVGGWTDMGLPTGFAYDTWYTLGIEITNAGFLYTVGDLALLSPLGGSTQIGNTILQGHNTTAGVSYDIYWDNLVTAVPLPPSAWAGLALLGGLGITGLVRNRKEQLASLA